LVGVIVPVESPPPWFVYVPGPLTVHHVLMITGGALLVKVPLKLLSQGQFVVNRTSAFVTLVITDRLPPVLTLKFVAVEVLVRLTDPALVQFVVTVKMHQCAVPRSTRPGAGQSPMVSLLVTIT